MSDKRICPLCKGKGFVDANKKYELEWLNRENQQLTEKIESAQNDGREVLDALNEIASGDFTKEHMVALAHQCIVKIHRLVL